jgi:tetratricopeptide (TPR) repeat protein
MSLLLEALKKAERAKEEAQKRTREGEAESTEELRLADEAPVPADDKRVVTRDELPPITSPLEIQSEDLGAPRGGAEPGGLSLQGSSAPAAASAPRASADAQATQRASARRAFEAKVREPNPRLPFYITMGALGVACVATVIYFWIQLSSPPTIYNANPKPPAGESQAAVIAPSTSASGPVAAPSNVIPGLPSTPQAPVDTQTVAAAPETKEATAPRPAASIERPVVAPKPRARARVAPPASRRSPIRAAVARARPPARINPLVASGYAAYQAGDMERARRDYGAALREEPANRDALLGLAAVETRAQRFPVAEALYRRLLETNPRDPHALSGLLGLRAAETDPVGAASRLKGMIANDSAESVLYFTLGNQFAQQARWPEAERAYARAVGMDPDNPDFAYNYAVSLEHTRQPLAALQQYRRALVLGLQRTASFDPAAAQLRVQTLSR